MIRNGYPQAQHKDVVIVRDVSVPSQEYIHEKLESREGEAGSLSSCDMEANMQIMVVIFFCKWLTA